MKPESQLMMYLLNKQGHPIQAESINTPNMENTEAISKKKNDLFVLGLWDSPYMSGKSQPELLTRSVLVHVNCTADTGDPVILQLKGLSVKCCREMICFTQCSYLSKPDNGT